MPCGTSSDFSNAAPVAQGMFKRSVQGVGDETKRIKKIALACAILSDEEVQASQSEGAPSDAHKILQHDFTKKCGLIAHIASFSGSPHIHHTGILPSLSKNKRSDTPAGYSPGCPPAFSTLHSPFSLRVPFRHALFSRN
jgi:hypothetical protein